MKKKGLRFISLLALSFLFVVGVSASGYAAAPVSVTTPIVTDVSQTSFSAVWASNQAASASMKIYSDEAATLEVTDLTVELQSNATAQTYGVIKVKVTKAIPNTTYYFKTVTTAKDGGEVYTSSASYAVTTAMMPDAVTPPNNNMVGQRIFKDAAKTEPALGTLVIGTVNDADAISPITAWVQEYSGGMIYAGLDMNTLIKKSNGDTFVPAGKTLNVVAFGGILGSATTTATVDAGDAFQGLADAVLESPVFYTITPQLTGNGTITPYAAAQVYAGSDYTVTVTPATAGDTVTATDNGANAALTQVGNAYTYTLTGIIADHTIAVTFGGGGIVPTLMDIPTAVLAIEAGDTVIDANAAEYVNEHITGAITADAVLPPDKATRILVYGRDAAAALALATSLVGQGYTNVAYLDATFAAFAADTTKVTDAMVQYKLTVNTVGAGAVTGNSTDGFHNRNAIVNLVADPLTVTWSGNAPNGVVTMTAPQTVTATFEGAVNTPPVANDFSFEIPVGGHYSGKLVGTDADPGDTLTYIKVTEPAQGILEINTDGNFEYDEPSTAGTVTATFKVNDGKDDSSTALITITVTAIPTCDAVATFTATTSDLTATFDTTGSVGTLSFDYGDGTPAGSATTHTYTAAGTYSVTLTTTGTGGCTSTPYTQPVTVTAPVCDAVAIFTATTSDLTATFDTTGSVGTLSFDYGDGTPAGASTTHTYAAAGTYSVTLTTTGTGGCTSTPYTQSVTVTAPVCDAVAAFTVAASGLTATVNAAGSAGTLSFDYGDGTPAGTATTHTYAADGTYTVTLTATGTGGCTKTATKSVTVSSGACDAIATLSIVTVDNLQVTLDTPGAVGSIMFNYGDGTSGAGYVHTYTAAGTYVITVTATGANGCTDTVTQSFTIGTIPGEPDGDGDCNNVVDIYDALLAAQMDVCTTNGVLDEACLNNLLKDDDSTTIDKTVDDLCIDMLDVDQNGLPVDINDALAIAKYDVGLNCNCVLDAKK